MTVALLVHFSFIEIFKSLTWRDVIGFEIGRPILSISEDYIQPTFWWIQEETYTFSPVSSFKSLPVAQDIFLTLLTLGFHVYENSKPNIPAVSTFLNKYGHNNVLKIASNAWYFFCHLGIRRDFTVHSYKYWEVKRWNQKLGDAVQSNALRGLVIWTSLNILCLQTTLFLIRADQPFLFTQMLK